MLITIPILNKFLFTRCKELTTWCILSHSLLINSMNRASQQHFLLKFPTKYTSSYFPIVLLIDIHIINLIFIYYLKTINLVLLPTFIFKIKTFDYFFIIFTYYTKKLSIKIAFFSFSSPLSYELLPHITNAACLLIMPSCRAF